MKITALSAKHLRLPFSRGRVSLNSPSRNDLLDVLLVDMETDADLLGMGFTYFLGPGAAAAKQLIEAEIAPQLIGTDPRRVEKQFARIGNYFRQSEFHGLVARAYAPIDVALWDLKAKAQNEPLWRLLGEARNAARAFVSDLGMLSVDLHDLPKAIKPLLDQGAIGLLAEIGSGSVETDAERIHDLRHAIGESAWLGVSCREKFDFTTALGLSQYLQEEMEIDWFEEPLPLDDSMGYSRLADRLEVPLVLGTSLARHEEYLPWLRAGIPRVVRADLARLGGITPWLKVASTAEAFHLTVCPVRLPEVGIQLGCGLPNVHQIDYVGWLNPLFEEPLKFSKGFLQPPASTGLGLTWNEKAVAKFRIG